MLWFQEHKRAHLGHSESQAWDWITGSAAATHGHKEKPFFRVSVSLGKQ